LYLAAHHTLHNHSSLVGRGRTLSGRRSHRCSEYTFTDSRDCTPFPDLAGTLCPGDGGIIAAQTRQDSFSSRGGEHLPIRHLSTVAVLLLFAACRPAEPPASRSEDRFELKQDDRGRVLRLDKTTGEMAIVRGDQLIPITSAKGDTASRAPRQTAGVPDSSKNARGEQASTKSPSPQPAAPTSPVPLESMIGRRTNLQTPAPVFITATARQTPLTVLPAGFPVRVIGSEGERYLVEFEDPQWGQRAGFVGASAIGPGPRTTSRSLVEATRREPPTPPAQEPIDLSIPDREKEPR
jgi:hypothetical protein